MFNTSLNNGGSEKVGSIKAFGGSVAPFGWLICDGSAISRTLYAELFAIIGTTYGAGDGSTTFNIPDTNSRFLEGNGTGFVAAGLPNIIGTFYNDKAGGSSEVSGCISATSYGQRNSATSQSGGQKYTIDASLSSSIYGNSTTVQPAACKCYFIIKY